MLLLEYVDMSKVQPKFIMELKPELATLSKHITLHVIDRSPHAADIQLLLVSPLMEHFFILLVLIDMYVHVFLLQIYSGSMNLWFIYRYGL